MLKKQEKQKQLRDPKSPRLVDLVPDDLVNVRNYSRGPKWIPAKVECQTGPVSYKLITRDGNDVKHHQNQIVLRNLTSPVKTAPETNTPNIPSSPVVHRSTRTVRAPERLDL